MRFILYFVLLIFSTLCSKKEEIKPAPLNSQTMPIDTTSSFNTSTISGITTVTSSNSLPKTDTTKSIHDTISIEHTPKDSTISVLPVTTVGTATDTTPTSSVKKFTIIALGDSYTIGESVPANQKYPVQLVTKLKEEGYSLADPKVIARTGWTTDELINGIKTTNDTNTYDFAFLLIGVNNQYRGRPVSTYTPEFEALLTTALGYVKNQKSHVFVVSIPDYGYTPVGAANQVQISAGIDAYNAENKRISDSVGVTYIEITDISRGSESGLVANDGLHPSAYQYSKWVDRMLPEIRQLLP